MELNNIDYSEIDDSLISKIKSITLTYSDEENLYDMYVEFNDSIEGIHYQYDSDFDVSDDLKSIFKLNKFEYIDNIENPDMDIELIFDDDKNTSYNNVEVGSIFEYDAKLKRTYEMSKVSNIHIKYKINAIDRFDYRYGYKHKSGWNYYKQIDIDKNPDNYRSLSDEVYLMVIGEVLSSEPKCETINEKMFIQYINKSDNSIHYYGY